MAPSKRAKQVGVVEQQDRSGCGLAAVAMIAGVSYEEVRGVWLDEMGGDPWMLIALGGGLTVAEVEKLLERFGSGARVVEAPAVAIVRREFGLGHYVVIGETGEVIDPDGKERP